MHAGHLDFDNVTFFYEASSTPVLEGLSVRVPLGWTGLIGPNGAGKTTLLRLACGLLTPTSGRVLRPDTVVYCRQRTDDPPEQLAAMLNAGDGLANELRGQLRVDADALERWSTLSHGERKRTQIAVALWQEPAVLAIDEPTNHIDADARQRLGRALRSFRGRGLLVSHDRDLLDALCEQCLVLESPHATMVPGGYTKAMAVLEAERDRLRRERDQQRLELKRLRREAANRRREADRADARRSKRGIARKDHDAKERIDRARVTGKDGQAGRRLAQMQGRLDQARDRLATIDVAGKRKLGIGLPGDVARRDFLLRVEAGSIALGGDRRLAFDELTMGPDDRIALVGPNGSGKSTLIRHLLGHLDLPEQRLVYLPQEIPRDAARGIIREVRGLTSTERGDVLSVVSRLGSQPERLLDTDEPSPGELRKILLALGVARTPHLIVMDEPTNHLDLPSIECLQAALAECPAALLLVSHDERFLKALTRTRWAIAESAAAGENRVCVQRGPLSA